MPISTVGVVGLGYVGQPLMAALANVGYNVIGLDINERRVAELSATYKPSLYEPGLAETLARCQDRIRFTMSYEELMRESEGVCLTVWTPVNDQKLPESASLDAAVSRLGRYLTPGQTIILRSTVMPGTTARVAAALERISGLQAGRDFFVSFCPERTIEGIALYELYNLPVIVGGINDESTQRTVEIFRRLVNTVIPVSSPLVAELCKLADNMYRALNIAFANELGDICERAHADAHEVVQAVNLAYPRTNIFRPGLGAGGPCLSKDPLILRYFAELLGVTTPLIDITAGTTLTPVHRILGEVRNFLTAHRVAAPRIALFGLAFKGMPETDDLRGSAASLIYEDLSSTSEDGESSEVEFAPFDPIVREFFGIPVMSRVEECLQHSNVVLFLTDHPSVRNVPMELILQQTARPLIIVDVWHNVREFEREILPPDVTYIRVGDGR